MKITHSLIAITGLLAGIAFGSVQAAPSAQAALPLGTVRAIQGNAQAAHDNAAIYQWGRVNLEVDRIIAAEHSLEQALSKSAAVPTPAAALRQAVLDLRAARLARDPDKTQAAAQQVSSQCALLLH